MNTQSSTPLVRLKRAKKNHYNPLSSNANPTQMTRKLDAFEVGYLKEAVNILVHQCVVDEEGSRRQCSPRFRARRTGEECIPCDTRPMVQHSTGPISARHADIGFDDTTRKQRDDLIRSKKAVGRQGWTVHESLPADRRADAPGRSRFLFKLSVRVRSRTIRVLPLFSTLFHHIFLWGEGGGCRGIWPTSNNSAL